MSQNIPVVDEARVKKIFKRLEVMDVVLDNDPLEYGPKRLNFKVAEARRMASECERIYLNVAQDLQVLKSAHRQADLDFNLQMQDLLANDPEVRSNRNIQDRGAAATMKLRTERENLDRMDVFIQDLVMVMSVIKAKRADLKDIQGRLRDQVNLCREEIGLGSFWGSKPVPGSTAPNLDTAPKVSRSALEQFNAFIKDDGEVTLSFGDDDGEEEPATLLPGEGAEKASDGDVDALLLEVEANARHAVTETPRTEAVDEDLDSLVNSVVKSVEATETPAAPESEEEEESPIVDVFAGDEPVKDATVALGALNSDEDVESFFDNLSTGSSAVPAEEVDLDDLVAMLG